MTSKGLTSPGDAPLRYVTVQMFFKPEQYEHYCDFTYYHQFMMKEGEMISSDVSGRFYTCMNEALEMSRMSGSKADCTAPSVEMLRASPTHTVDLVHARNLEHATWKRQVPGSVNAYMSAGDTTSPFSPPSHAV